MNPKLQASVIIHLHLRFNRSPRKSTGQFSSQSIGPQRDTGTQLSGWAVCGAIPTSDPWL